MVRWRIKRIAGRQTTAGRAIVVGTWKATRPLYALKIFVYATTAHSIPGWRAIHMALTYARSAGVAFMLWNTNMMVSLQLVPRATKTYALVPTATHALAQPAQSMKTWFAWTQAAVLATALIQIRSYVIHARQGASLVRREVQAAQRVSLATTSRSKGRIAVSSAPRVAIT